MKSRFGLILLFMALCSAWAGDKPNVAVLPFTGDKSVSPEQLSFITGKFASELAETKSFQILDRTRMDFILQEQGFQQSGACDGAECRMQMGQMLGVDHVVAGTLVRFDATYAFRADYVDVATGRVEHSVEQARKGDLSEAYGPLCQKAAQDLSLKANPQLAFAPSPSSSSMSLKRKIALGLFASSLLGAGGGLYEQSLASAAHDDYDKAWEDRDYKAASVAYADYGDARSLRNAGFGFSAGTALVGAVLWFWPE